MRKASEMINEAQEIKLSKDWEITWSDWHAPIARDFLKKMDDVIMQENPYSGIV